MPKLKKYDSNQITLELLNKKNYYIMKNQKNFNPKACSIDISSIKPGMIWYCDNTFSFDVIADKKRKAIVELVENGTIYGDLTASEICVNERHLKWLDAKKYIRAISYPCTENEIVTMYGYTQLKNVKKNYDLISQTFKRIGKEYRKGLHWASDFCDSKDAYAVDFTFGSIQVCYDKKYAHYVRPVLALKVEAL